MGKKKTRLHNIVLLALALLLLSPAGFPEIGARAAAKPSPLPVDTCREPAVSPEGRKIGRIAPHWHESSRPIYFDIPARISFRLDAPDQKRGARLLDGAWKEFERIGKIFNPFDPDSQISAINHDPPLEWRDISEDLYRLLTICQRLWKTSEGAFDPTFLPVKKMWQRAEKEQQVPSERRIRNALSRTGFAHVSLRSKNGRPQLRVAKPSINFDFGGIAKGYAVDAVRTYLLDAGAVDGLVQLGGEIAAFGESGKGKWRVGIQHPLRMHEMYGVLESPKDLKVSTSGNYRQPIMIRGFSFYHIFSPLTGRPVSVKVLGVTTAASGPGKSSALLDGAATAITVLGPLKGRDLAEKLGIEALVLTQDSGRDIRETMTRGFADLYDHR